MRGVHTGLHAGSGMVKGCPVPGTGLYNDYVATEVPALGTVGIMHEPR